jgi:hypothetical protein
MRTLFASAAILLAIGVTNSLSAQDALVASDTDFLVQTSGGMPAFCVFEFTLAYRDRLYRQGAVAGVTGTLNWMEAKGNLGLMLKIVGRDFPNAGTADWTPEPFPVVHGFIVIDGQPTPPLHTLGCEEPTAFCATYELPTSADIFHALTAGKIGIGFSRKANGLDVTLPLDVATAASKTAEYQAYNQCMATMADRVMAKLKN